MSVFDEATAVRRRAEGVYDALPDQRFAVVTAGGSTPPAVNGGALIAQVLRAVLDDSPNPHPVATTANFLRVARLAPARDPGGVAEAGPDGVDRPGQPGPGRRARSWT